MIGTSTQLLVTIASAMGAVAGIAAAISKVADMLTKKSANRREWEREDFESALDALKAENARCWAERDREHEANLLLEKRLQFRRDENHWLNNVLSTYVLLHGEIEGMSPRPLPPADVPNEDGEPT